MRSWRWWVSVETLPLWLAAIVFAWAGWNAAANRSLAAQFERMRTAGQPLRLVQCAPPPIPDADNVAPRYVDALARVSDPPVWDAGRDWSAPLEGPSRRSLEAWVKVHAPTIDALRAIPPGRCRWPIDWSLPLGSHGDFLDSMLHSEQLLSTAARLAFERGERDTAAELIAADLRLVRSLLAEHNMNFLSGAYQLAWNAGELCCAYAAAGGRITESLRRDIDALPPGIFAAGLPGCYASDLAVGIESIMTRLSRAGPARDGTPFLNPFYRGLLADFSALIELLRHAAAQPPEQRAWLSPEILRLEGAGIQYLMSGKEHIQLCSSFIVADVRLDLLRIALDGIEIARRDGAWPASWPELERRLDRHSGRPYRVRRYEDGVVIYGVGRNFDDDGGHGAKDVPMRIPLRAIVK